MDSPHSFYTMSDVSEVRMVFFCLLPEPGDLPKHLAAKQRDDSRGISEQNCVGKSPTPGLVQANVAVSDRCVSSSIESILYRFDVMIWAALLLRAPQTQTAPRWIDPVCLCLYLSFSRHINRQKCRHTRIQRNNKVLTLSAEVSPASRISPDNVSSVVSQEVHYYYRRVSLLLHHNQYCSIKVMNGPFPQTPAVATNSPEPLLQISQCRHGSTTTGQSEG